MTWNDVLKIVVALIGGSALSIIIVVAMIKIFVNHMLEKDRDNAIARHNEDLQNIKNKAQEQLEAIRQGHDDMVREREHLHQEKMKEFDAALVREQDLFKQSFEKILQEKEHSFAENMQIKTQEADEKLEGIKKEYALLNEKILTKTRVVTPKQVDVMLELYELFDASCLCIEKMTSLYKPIKSEDVQKEMKKKCDELYDKINSFTEIYRKGRILMDKNLCDNIEQVLYGQKYLYGMMAPAIHSYWSERLIQNKAAEWNKLGEKMKALSEELTRQFRNNILG